MSIEEHLAAEAEARIYALLKTCPEADRPLYYHQLERLEQLRRARAAKVTGETVQ